MLLKVLNDREKRKRELSKHALVQTKKLIASLKQRFHFDSVYIYGSILSGKFGPHSDIDLVIQGIKVEEFYKAYAFLIGESEYEIDLKPFEEISDDFREKVIQRGIKIG